MLKQVYQYVIGSDNVSDGPLNEYIPDSKEAAIAIDAAIFCTRINYHSNPGRPAFGGRGVSKVRPMAADCIHLHYCIGYWWGWWLDNGGIFRIAHPHID